MKILQVWASATWSTYDVARGYNNALKAAGHEVFDYRLYNRIGFAARGVPEEYSGNVPLLTRIASESMVVEALQNDVDLILITSAVAVHPNGPFLARKAGFKVAVIHTESPYEDEPQKEFSQYCDFTFTQEAVSAKRYGWHYLAHAYDPAIHYPVKPDPQRISPLTGPCDVLILGTGWPERVQLLTQTDWTGIDLRILGLWPEIEEGHPLRKFYTEVIVNNEDTPHLYNSAKICFNQHRHHPWAQSLNPRAYEIAACGAFQLSDYRQEISNLGGGVPVYRNAGDLGPMIRHYLASGWEREGAAQAARRAVKPHTFKARVEEMMKVVEPRL